jgi:pimeloyl-ACP methyl ester carboxylesterase
MRRHWRAIALMLIAVLVGVAAVGYLWLTDLADPMPQTEAALVYDDRVTVSTDPWLTFTPNDVSSTGFVFYPGARVPVEAYAPAMHAIADAGYLSVAVPMPFGLAVLAPNAADDVIDAYPEVDRWVIGGHSLGGAMAAGYAADHDVGGLALWAAYPAADNDLGDHDIAVTSIYASNDGLATPDDIEGSIARLPADTNFVEIAGGNHAGFGWYGPQDGDGEATISREQQQDEVVAATLHLIEAVEAG